MARRPSPFRTSPRSSLGRLLGGMLLLALAACGDSSGSSGEPPPDDAPEVPAADTSVADVAADVADDGGTAGGPTIGPEGGVVIGPDGVWLTVPPGALAAPVTFAIRVTADDEGGPALPAPLIPVGDTVVIGPTGTVFAVPASLSLPYDPARVPDGEADTLAVYTSTGGAPWAALETATEDVAGRATAALGHLSRFTLATGCRRGGEGCAVGDCCLGLGCFEQRCDACRGEGGACSSSEHCCDGTVCQDGVCRACVPRGGDCGASGGWCCDAHETACLGGVCAACRPAGADCGDAFDCCGGLFCVGGTCSEECAPRGEACSIDADCCGAGVAGDWCSGGRCVGCVEVGGACPGGTCCEGSFCDGLECTSCRGEGGPCLFGSECCEGRCEGGACVSCFAAEHPCETGADCCSGVCTGHVCDACPGDGAGCGAAADCCPGSCCEWTARVCLDGVCSSCRPLGGDCSGWDATCCGDLLCIDGTCGECRELDASCSGYGQCCDEQPCVDGTCTRCRERGEACADDAPCCSDRCAFGVCSECRQPGELCGDNDDCCDWQCEDGYCRTCVVEGEPCDEFHGCCGYLSCDGGVCAQLCSLPGDDCSEERPCCERSICWAGVCEACRIAGDSCAEDPCCEGLLCGDDDVCYACGGEVDPCSPLRECCEGFTCDDAVCLPCSLAGESCEHDPCCGALSCHEGACVECAWVGASCADRPCCTNAYCVDDACVACGATGDSCAEVPCCDRYTCRGGVCELCGEPGEPCGSPGDEPCCDPLGCGPEGVCETCSGPGLPCDGVEPCCLGLRCVTGWCVADRPARTCDDPVYSLGEPMGELVGALSPDDGDAEGVSGCPDGFGDAAPYRGDGPDEWVELPWPAGAALVAAVRSVGVASSLQVRSACGAADPAQCFGSSWSGRSIGWPTGGTPAGVATPGPDDAWWSGVALAPAAAKSGDGETVRLVVDARQAPGDTVSGDYTLRWRVLDAPPDNDTAAGATVVEVGRPVAPESPILATDAFASLGCGPLADGLGAGSADLFYRFTAPADGLYVFRAAWLNEIGAPDAFVAVLDAAGACVATGRAPNGRELKALVALGAGEEVTIVVDVGSLPPGTLYLFQADAYAGPPNTTCTAAAEIAALPATVTAALAGGFDDVALEPASAWLHGRVSGGADLVWRYTPPADQWVRMTLASETEGFWPALTVATDCAGDPATVTPFEAFSLPSDGAAASVVRRLTAGVGYHFVVDGGTFSQGTARLTLEEAEPDAPDGCDRALVVPAVPTTVRLSGRELTDRFQGSAETPVEGWPCTIGFSPVGEGEPDAVLAYTATEDGVLGVSLVDHVPDAVYAVKGGCAEGLQAACGGPPQGGDRADIALAAGETAHVILDGWPHWGQVVEVALSWSDLPANETCATAAAIAPPFEASSFLAFAADDIRVVDAAPCAGLATDGGELVWRYDPGGTPTDLAVAVVGADFDWTLYAVGACDDNPTPACRGGTNTPGWQDPTHVVFEDVAVPLHVVVDHGGAAAGGAFTLLAQEATTPPHDTCAGAVEIPALPFRTVGSTLGAANDYGVPAGVCPPGFGPPFESAMGADVVYRLAVTHELKTGFDHLEVAVEQASFDAHVVVLRNGCDVTTDCTHTGQAAHRAVPLGLFEVGDTVHVVVSGAEDDARGSGLFTLAVTAHP